MTDHGHKIYRIKSDEGEASFAPSYGARGLSLKLSDAGGPREILYIRPDFWTTKRDPGGLPFLFPVCGRHIRDDRLGSYRLDDESYEMPLHGFSLTSAWHVDDCDGNRLALTLTDNEKTRNLFPFSFRVSLEYRMDGNRLVCRQEYENRSKKRMPFFSGFHPYVAAENLDTATCRLEGSFTQVGQYDQTLARIASWSPFTADFNPVDGARRQNVLEYDASAPVAMYLNGQRHVTLTFTPDDDRYRARYLQLYRSNEDPFICLEPWMSLPNGLNEPDRIPFIEPEETVGALFTMSL